LLESVKSVCQLEGSDHGGRDSAAELALAGTIDVQIAGWLLQLVDLGANPPDGHELYTSKNDSQRLFKHGILVPISTPLILVLRGH
jgi:hypothetical protein